MKKEKGEKEMKKMITLLVLAVAYLVFAFVTDGAAASTPHKGKRALTPMRIVETNVMSLSAIDPALRPNVGFNFYEDGGLEIFGWAEFKASSEIYIDGVLLDIVDWQYSRRIGQANVQWEYEEQPLAAGDHVVSMKVFNGEDFYFFEKHTTIQPFEVYSGVYLEGQNQVKIVFYFYPLSTGEELTFSVCPEVYLLTGAIPVATLPILYSEMDGWHAEYTMPIEDYARIQEGYFNLRFQVGRLSTEAGIYFAEPVPVDGPILLGGPTPAWPTSNQ